ncbi:hypothetical protein QYS60_21265 [Rhodococcus sp. GXMU-t2271]|uniref:hypothetical protein n=1 Tax=Rhodococcus sp. GXMU-t2271 TaxID=3059079 RepID=UPI003529EE75
MGIFGPSRQEKLRSHPIVAANWRRHMDHRVPEYGELVASALKLAGRSEDDVDVAAMRRRAQEVTEAVLKEDFCSKPYDLSWSDLQIVLSRSDYSSALLSDYLSTCGAFGAVANDKLAQLMTDRIPELLADAVRKGFFDRDTKDPTHMARIIGAAGATPPSGDATARLPDPGLDENNPMQLAYDLFKACGITILSFGNLSLEQLARLLLQDAPIFGDTVVRPHGIGFLAGHDDRPWIGFEGPQGSVIAYFAASGGDFMHDVLMPMSALPPPTRWGIGTVGARMPAEVASILASAHVVPLWELAAFAEQRPADDLAVPLQLAADLVDDGWASVGNGVFTTDVAVAAGPTLAVFFSPYNSESFGLMTPLDKDECVPDEVRTRSFGRYELDAVEDTAVLCQRYPAQPTPSAQALAADAWALATYTHHQFATPGEPHSIAKLEGGRSAPPSTTGEAPRLKAEISTPRMQHLQAAERGWPPRVEEEIPAPRTQRSQATKRRLALVGLLILAVILTALVAYQYGRSPVAESTANSSGGDAPNPPITAAVGPCSNDPVAKVVRTRTDDTGLILTLQLTASCAEGDVLSNDSFLLAVTENGSDVAAAAFDLSQTPLALPPDGGSVQTQFRFLPGSYWQVPEDIAVSSLSVTTLADGASHAVNGIVVAGDSRIIDQAAASSPEGRRSDAAAREGLRSIADTDRQDIRRNLVDRWVPQISSKRPGLFAEGISWTDSEILREHMALRLRFPQATLVWTGDWSTFTEGNWWVTIVGITFVTGEDANRWCRENGLGPEHCFAKLVSTTRPEAGSTVYQK